MLAFLKLSTCLLSLRTGCVVIALLVTLCTSEIRELNRASSENAKNDFGTLPPPSPPPKKKRIVTYLEYPLIMQSKEF